MTDALAAVQMQLAKESAPQSTIDRYSAAIAKNPNLSLLKRRELASGFTKEPIFFDWDIPRTREGHYHYKNGLPAATKRAIEFGPYADLLWLETGDPNVEKAAGFAKEIRSAYPGKQLVYNLSPSFNWMAHGFDEAGLKSFIWDLAKHG